MVRIFADTPRIMLLRTAPAAILLLAGLMACRSKGHDEAFWRTATCVQLNGLRFKITCYRDNRWEYDDVIFFRNDTLISEKWSAAGFHTSMMECSDSPPGVLTVKAVQVNTSNDWRQYALTIAGGRPDGTVMAGTRDGAAFTYTMAGEEE